MTLDPTLISSGLTIEECDGFHEDGWCWPRTRLRIRATSDAIELRIGVWLPELHDAPPMAKFTIESNALQRSSRYVPYGEPTELIFPLRLRKGDELSFEIGCNNLMPMNGEDKRELSFKLLSLVLM